MQAQRDALFLAFQQIKSAIDAPIFQDVDPSTGSDNPVGRLLRNGLCVISFNHLEIFLTACARNCLRQMARSRIPYLYLPHKLREIITINSLKGIVNEIVLDKSLDVIGKLAKVEPLIVEAAGFNTPTPSYSGHGFNHSGSNLYGDDVTDLLRALRYEGGWRRIGNIARDIGGGRPSLSDDFKRFASMRHAAAHKADAQILANDLVEMIDAAMIIAVSVDILLLYALNVYGSMPVLSRVESKLEGVKLSIGRLQMQADGSVKESSLFLREPNPARDTRVFKVHANRGAAVASSLQKHGVTALFDLRGLPVGFWAN